MSLKAEIEAAELVFMASYKNKDWKALSECYVPNCILMPPGGPEMTGRDAVIKVFSGASEAGVSGVKLIANVVDKAGELAIERGEWQFFDKDGTMFQNGKFLVVWEKLNGKWHLQTDIWNADA